MLLDMPPTIYIAQVYSCDAYSSGNYSECPVTSTEPSSGSGSSSSSPSSNTTTNPNPDGTDQDSYVSNTPVSGTDTPGTGTTQPEPNGAENSFSEAVAKADWGLITLIAIIVSVLIAGLILLFKRRRRKEDEQLPPPSTPINPSGPSNPFSTGL